MWCNPVPSSVSPIYIPGLFLTASRPFKTLIFEESYEVFFCFFSDALIAFFGIQYYKSITLFNLIFSGFFIADIIFCPLTFSNDLKAKIRFSSSSSAAASSTR